MGSAFLCVFAPGVDKPLLYIILTTTDWWYSHLSLRTTGGYCLTVLLGIYMITLSHDKTQFWIWHFKWDNEIPRNWSHWIPQNGINFHGNWLAAPTDGMLPWIKDKTRPWEINPSVTVTHGYVPVRMITTATYTHVGPYGLSATWFIEADSRFAPSQWETTLLCNDVSHCLGASLQSALVCDLYATFDCQVIRIVWNLWYT